MYTIDSIWAGEDSLFAWAIRATVFSVVLQSLPGCPQGWSDRVKVTEASMLCHFLMLEKDWAMKPAVVRRKYTKKEFEEWPDSRLQQSSIGPAFDDDIRD
jgi:hypothetical protein